MQLPPGRVATGVLLETNMLHKLGEFVVRAETSISFCSPRDRDGIINGIRTACVDILEVFEKVRATHSRWLAMWICIGRGSDPPATAERFATARMIEVRIDSAESHEELRRHFIAVNIRMLGIRGGEKFLNEGLAINDWL